MKPGDPDIWRASFFAVSEAITNIVAKSEKYEPEKSEKILVPWESIAEEEFRRA